MMKEILILQKIIEHYRVPLYEELMENSGYSITGLYSSKKQAIYPQIDTLKGDAINFKGLLFQWGFWKLVIKKKYAIIIGAFNIRVLSNILLLFLSRLLEVKFVWWGIGFGKYRKYDRVRIFLAKKADAIIVYEDNSAKKMIRLGVDPKKVFVMHNTVHVKEPSACFDPKRKTSFLFIGGLQERKRIDIFLEAFSKVSSEINERICVEIVGDGPERSRLEALVSSLKIQDRVKFHGQVYDEFALKEYFDRSILAFSIGQAGLSVLTSFAHGVGFLTMKDAISGGEIENIKDGYNGYLGEEKEEIEKIIILLANNPVKAVEIGVNAFNFYVNNRRMDQMANAFIRAIESTMMN